MPRGWPGILWRVSRSLRGIAAKAQEGWRNSARQHDGRNPHAASAMPARSMAIIFDKGMVLPREKIALVFAPFSK